MWNHYRLRSHLAFVLDQCKHSISSGMHCFQRSYNAFTSINTTNYMPHQIRCGNWCPSQLHTTNTTNKLCLINLFTTFHATKLLKLLCFSAVLLYTQLSNVLHPNNPNVTFIPITIPLPTHIPSIFSNSNPIWNAFHSSCTNNPRSYPLVHAKENFLIFTFSKTMLQPLYCQTQGLYIS